MLLQARLYILKKFDLYSSVKLLSQTTAAKRPLTTLQKSVKKTVIVRLKNEVEYKGKMKNVDSYMNLIMTEAEELNDGKTSRKIWESYSKRKQRPFHKIRRRNLIFD